MSRDKIIILVLIFACVLLVSTLVKGCQDAKELDNLNQALDAELETWVDKNGKHIAKIETLESTNTELFTELNVKDTLIKELQDEVKKAKSKLKQGGSVTIIEGETKFDTLFIDNSSKVYTSLFKEPIKSSVKNEWIDASFALKLDSISDSEFKVGEVDFSLLSKNKYIVTLGREKGKPFTMVKNLNPYSETTAVRAYQTKYDEPKKLTIGAFAGPGILVSKEVKAGFVTGVGLNYKF